MSAADKPAASEQNTLRSLPTVDQPLADQPLPGNQQRGPLRVVHIITRLIVGGAQENTLLTVEGQHRDYGDAVTLVTGPGLGPEGSLIDRASQAGFDLRVLQDLRREIAPFKDFKSYRRLLQILRELQPDVVHTHSSKAGILGRAAAHRLGIPVVHTIHGAAFHRGQHWLAHRLYISAEKWAGKRCDRFISVCDAMTAQYLEAGIATPDRYVTIYSGMDVEPFLNPPRSRDEVRQGLGFGPDDIVIGKIARLFHLKGHEFVIRAAAEVVRQNPRVRFLFVGNGILHDEFQRQILAAGLEGHFVFTGLVPPSQIPELIAAMDIAVHTSLWEGLARVLPQALIAGKPVVSYDVDGAREVVIPQETGYLLPAESVEELAQALIELANDLQLREQFGQTGRSRFLDQFRHQTMTRRIREIYFSLLD